MAEQRPANPNRGEGRVLVVSGPSASGKSTLVDELIKEGEFPFRFSVSATTREPRSGEIEGVHYRFVTRADFDRLRRDGELLESAEVYGQWYGTPRRPVEEGLARKEWILLDIDPQGYFQVKQAMPSAIGVFVRAVSLDEYERRLRSRGTETEAQIARRLADAREQLTHARCYEYQILNEALDQGVRTFRTLLRGIAHS